MSCPFGCWEYLGFIDESLVYSLFGFSNVLGPDNLKNHNINWKLEIYVLFFLASSYPFEFLGDELGLAVCQPCSVTFSNYRKIKFSFSGPKVLELKFSSLKLANLLGSIKLRGWTCYWDYMFSLLNWAFGLVRETRKSWFWGLTWLGVFN